MTPVARRGRFVSSEGGAMQPKASTARDRRLHVLIAGGGVAALETMLALRDLAGDRADVELLAPEPHFWYRPLAVTEPFGAGRVHGIELVDLAAEASAVVTLGALGSVDTESRLARTSVGAEIGYDALVVACGARAVPAVPGALTFRGVADGEALAALVADVRAGAAGRVVFAVPGGSTWPLPLYELALMTAELCAESGVAPQLTLVTPESAPLGVFGAAAAAAVTALLDDRGVELRASTYPVGFGGGRLALAGAAPILADRVVALPRLEGPRVAGLPHDRNGFVPTDVHGRVLGVDDVYAAGDATTFPVKQGGIAAAQADAVAAAVAATLDPRLVAEPFRPVLRGLVLTRGGPTFLRADLTGGSGDTSTASADALWWPPDKLAAAHLAPVVAAIRGALHGTAER
jgi:sulfide:quinone oxidoreductase